MNHIYRTRAMRKTWCENSKPGDTFSTRVSDGNACGQCVGLYRISRRPRQVGGWGMSDEQKMGRIFNPDPTIKLTPRMEDLAKLNLSKNHYVSQDTCSAMLGEIAKLRTALTASQERERVALADLENLASDLEECARLAHIEKGEKRMLASFGKTARKILADLTPPANKGESK